MVYERIFKKNNAGKTGTQYQLSELKIPTQRSRGMTPQQPANDSSELSGITRSIKAYFKCLGDIFAWENLQSTVRMALVWSCIAFALHGSMWWLPEYLKHLQNVEYQTHRIEKINEFHNYSSFTGPLENTQFRDSEFLNTKFSKMIFSHVDFINCEFGFFLVSIYMLQKLFFFSQVHLLELTLSTSSLVKRISFSQRLLDRGSSIPTYCRNPLSIAYWKTTRN